MVFQRTVDNLKARPKHERRAVARGVAVTVVVVLFIGWLIIFFKNIRETGIQIKPIDIPKAGTLDTQALTDAKEQLESGFAEMQNAAASSGDNSETVPAMSAY